MSSFDKYDFLAIFWLNRPGFFRTVQKAYQIFHLFANNQISATISQNYCNIMGIPSFFRFQASLSSIFSSSEQMFAPLCASKLGYCSFPQYYPNYCLHKGIDLFAWQIVILLLVLFSQQRRHVKY